MGICHSSEATANRAAIEPVRTPPTALAPISLDQAKLNGNLPPLALTTPPSPPSVTVNTATNSPDTSLNKLEDRNDAGGDKKTVDDKDSKENESTAPARRNTESASNVATDGNADNRRQSDSSSQSPPPSRRTRKDRESVSQHRPVTRRSTSGVSRAAQLFTEWSDSSPAPELPMDRGPRTVIINTHQPMRSSDAPLPDPANTEKVSASASETSEKTKPMHSVSENKAHP